jgi:hypothetical protein
VADPLGGDAFFERASRGMAALRDLVEESRSSVAEPVDGTDTSGSVRVVFASDGLPERIELDEDWRRGVGAEGFGAAVTQACQGAMAAYSTALDHAAERTGWLDRVNKVMNYLGSDGPPPPGLPPPQSPATSVDTLSRTDPRRSLAEIVGDLAALSDSVSFDDALRAAPPKYTGSGRLGRLTLTLDATAAVTCTADAEWVGRQETEDLRTALSAALESLRADRSAGDAAQAAAAARPGMIAAEVTSLIDRTLAAPQNTRDW